MPITIYAKNTGWGLRSLPLVGSIVFLVPFVLFGWSFTFTEGKIIRFNPEIGKVIFSSDSSDAFNFKDS